MIIASCYNTQQRMQKHANDNGHVLSDQNDGPEKSTIYMPDSEEKVHSVHFVQYQTRHTTLST